MEPESQPPTPKQGMALVLITLLLLITIGSAVQGLWIYPGLLITEFGLLLLPSLLFLRWLRATHRAAPAARAIPPGPALMLGTSVGFLAFAMAVGLTLPILLGVLLAGGEYPGVPLPLAGRSDYAMALLGGAVAAPLCEEFLFRGILLASLRPYGAHRAVWLSALCFGVFHLDPLRFVPTLALGVVYGYLTVATASLTPAMVAHGINNGTALTLAYVSGAGGQAAEPLTFDSIREEMLLQIEQSPGLLGSLDPDTAVLMGVAAGALTLFAGGAMLAAVLFLVLRGLLRRPGAPSWSPPEVPPPPVRRLAGLWGVLVLGGLVWGRVLWLVFGG